MPKIRLAAMTWALARKAKQRGRSMLTSVLADDHACKETISYASYIFGNMAIAFAAKNSKLRGFLAGDMRKTMRLMGEMLT